MATKVQNAPATTVASATKFLISSSALLKALTPLAGVVPNNPVVPILDCFRFSTRAGLLTVLASDLEVTLSTDVPVEGVREFTICLPARLLLDTLKALPDQPLTFTFDLDTYVATLSSVNGTYKLSGQNAADFPRVPDVAGYHLELPGSTLKRAIGKTVWGVSGDELRPAMTGVLVQRLPDLLCFVATDGHRLLRYTSSGTGGQERDNRIVPRKAMQTLGKLLSAEAPVQVTFSGSFASFGWDSFTLTTRLIDERYPDYENVIPISSPNQLTISRAELLGAVRRLSVYSNRTTHQIRLQLADAKLVLSAQDIDFGNEATETLPCQYAGQEMEIGFNTRFLLEMLGNLDTEEITLEMSAPNRAGLLRPVAGEENEDVLMLVMPVMLNNYV